MSIAGTERPLTEMLYGLVSGIAFGLTSPVVGHPFDTIKTNMQVQKKYFDRSMPYVFRDIVREGGLRSLYKGFLPPLLGSAVYRGIQFSAYSGGYAWAESQPFLSASIPFTGGLHLSVVFGAITGALARSSIESPLDFMKLRRMTSQSYLIDIAPPPTSLSTLFPHLTVRQFFHLYKGFVPTFLRTSLLFTAFFSLVDTSVRHIPQIINAPGYGSFFKGGICATAAWGFAFPLETTKSAIQGDARYKGMSTLEVIGTIMKEGKGLSSLYRGFSAGASRSFVANGASMLVYSSMQSELRKD